LKRVLKKCKKTTACHIWDMVFVKGPQAIFQVALAIFKLCEEKLIATEDMGVCVCERERMRERARAREKERGRGRERKREGEKERERER